jgi:hypothetical protein
LKYARHLAGENDLLSQFEKYGNELKNFEPEFKKLLEACVGMDVDFSRMGKIMVWPKSTSGKASDSVQKECPQRNITVIESETENWLNAKCLSFHSIGTIYPPGLLIEQKTI